MSVHEKQGVVFAVGPQIYHWQHDTETPQLLAVRPREVTSFCFTEGNTLIDGCRDGAVRATHSGETVMNFDTPVIGVCEAYSNDSPVIKTEYLLDKISKEFGIVKPAEKERLTIVTTSDGIGTSFHLGKRILAHHRDGRTGMAQSLSTHKMFFWANDGFIYRGLSKEQDSRFNDDFVQMVPFGYLNDFLILCSADTPIETTQFLRTRGGKNSRVLWAHDWRQNGVIIFAGLYTWPDEQGGKDWHLLYGTKVSPCGDYGKEFRVWQIPVREFSHGTPKQIFEVTLPQSVGYGYANPAIAHHQLLNFQSV